MEDFIWKRLLESAAAADTVLNAEKQLTDRFPTDRKFAFEERAGTVVRQYSTAFSTAFNNLLQGMVERRMRQSVYAVASVWYTCWVDAGQPDLTAITGQNFTEEDLKEFEMLNHAWRNNSIKSQEHEIP